MEEPFFFTLEPVSGLSISHTGGTLVQVDGEGLRAHFCEEQLEKSRAIKVGGVTSETLDHTRSRHVLCGPRD